MDIYLQNLYLTYQTISIDQIQLNGVIYYTIARLSYYPRNAEWLLSSGYLYNTPKRAQHRHHSIVLNRSESLIY